MKNYNQATLANGIRIIHQQEAYSNIVHCGIFFGIGSRDETHHNQGIAHFWEHMAFKGTQKRSSLNILTELDSVGGELNAYTDKEKIVFFSSVRLPYFEKSIDLLSDISFNSTLPATELRKEKSVILEEMSMYEDNPDDSLQDEFEKIIFGDHPMGMNILGRKETVSAFKRNDFFSFFNNHLHSENIVFSCLGNVPFSVVEKMANKYLGKIKFKNQKIAQRTKPELLTRQIALPKPVKQAKVALGGKAYSLHTPQRVPFFMLTNLLGGPGMNSRLNLSVREKHGYVLL
jgi:predicted Zn-dependent peptidase